MQAAGYGFVVVWGNTMLQSLFIVTQELGSRLLALAFLQLYPSYSHQAMLELFIISCNWVKKCQEDQQSIFVYVFVRTFSVTIMSWEIWLSEFINLMIVHMMTSVGIRRWEVQLWKRYIAVCFFGALPSLTLLTLPSRLPDSRNVNQLLCHIVSPGMDWIAKSVRSNKVFQLFESQQQKSK